MGSTGKVYMGFTYEFTPVMGLLTQRNASVNGLFLNLALHHKFLTQGNALGNTSVVGLF